MKRKLSFPVVILLDILLAGVILLGFALFHHVLPAWIAAATSQKTQATVIAATPQPTAAVTVIPEATVPPTPFVDEVIAPEPQITPEPTPTPEPKTEWQLRFAEFFTDEVIVTDSSYTSPNISVTVDKIETGEGAAKVTYFVADIYVASPENFCSYVVNGSPTYNLTAKKDILDLCEESDAILAINGDFINYQPSGFLMRNGELYMDNYTYCDICVLYSDGRMACFPRGGYNINDIIADGAVEVWNFGPSLLSAEGKALNSFNISTTVGYINPRSAVGYYEPGHYCFVVVDGRQEGYSAGMLLPDLAKVFEELGCVCAYNMDGGGSAVMVFNGERISRQSNGGDRSISDILLIRDIAPSEEYLVVGGGKE